MKVNKLVIKNLFELIGNDQINIAIKKIENLQLKGDYYNQILLLKARHESLLKEIRLGTIKNDDINIEKAKIRKGVIELIQTLDEPNNDSINTPDSNKIDRSEITEEDYYNISRRDNLVKRCPILNRCERRYWTLYYLKGIDNTVVDLGKKTDKKEISKILKNELLISDNYEHQKIRMIGQLITLVRSPYGIGFSNLCPEVSLFEEHQYQYNIPRISAISGRFNKSDLSSLSLNELLNNDRTYDQDGFYCSHFSECAEYSMWKESNIK